VTCFVIENEEEKKHEWGSKELMRYVGFNEGHCGDFTPSVGCKMRRLIIKISHETHVILFLST
jgi:hypothetical protein